MENEKQFLEALKANPGDDALRGVYADWLEEQGDARAPFVRGQGEDKILYYEQLRKHPEDAGLYLGFADYLYGLGSAVDKEQGRFIRFQIEQQAVRPEERKAFGMSENLRDKITRRLTKFGLRLPSEGGTPERCEKQCFYGFPVCEVRVTESTAHHLNVFPYPMRELHIDCSSRVLERARGNLGIAKPTEISALNRPDIREIFIEVGDDLQFGMGPDGQGERINASYDSASREVARNTLKALMMNKKMSGLKTIHIGHLASKFDKRFADILINPDAKIKLERLVVDSPRGMDKDVFLSLFGPDKPLAGTIVEVDSSRRPVPHFLIKELGRDGCRQWIEHNQRAAEAQEVEYQVPKELAEAAQRTYGEFFTLRSNKWAPKGGGSTTGQSRS